MLSTKIPLFPLNLFNIKKKLNKKIFEKKIFFNFKFFDFKFIFLSSYILLFLKKKN
jgi:hypothetical protein